MSRHPKVYSPHLERLAYVYIRQSSPRQVEQNLESQDLQYQLVHRAQTFGWAEDQIVVIDDDLGKTAITSVNRQGFQDLIGAVGLGKVGIILVTDVSRLARNCGDWYQLLDLASVCGTLVSDASGVYDPRNYDDRMLLGLKGAFAEAQWYNMRTQLIAAQLNKARRGELAIRLPIGYDRLANGVVYTPNQEVQGVIRLVFEQFERLGNGRAVMLYFRNHELELPRRVQSGPAKGEIEWVRPRYGIIHRILTHPAYAGAYTYGKRKRIRLPGAEGKTIVRLLPMEDWAVLKQDAFPGYISWEQYLKNRARLRENAQGTHWSKGAPRTGTALLQGIVLCARDGRQMHIRYGSRAAYVCDVTRREYGDPTCQTFTVSHIDEAITQVFLEAVQPTHLEVALAALEQVEAQRQSLATRWEQRLERARYEAELARRRYERVDPDMRLVAAELERRWEDKLQTQQRLEREWVQIQTQELTPLTETDNALIRQLAQDLPALWYANTTTQEERKRLIRCLIQDVSLNSFTKPGFSLIGIRWHTGTTTMMEVERPKPGCRTAKAVVERIRELAQHHPDDQIADILNTEEVRTATGKTWNRRRVETARKNYAIPTACPYSTSEPGPRGDGLIAASEAATYLGVSHSIVSHWFRQGLIVGHQNQRRSPLWVRLTEEDTLRLNGSASLLLDMVPVQEAPEALGMELEHMREEIRAGRLLTYRLRIKNQWRWYVQLPAERDNSHE